jgi:hypothetical protein
VVIRLREPRVPSLQQDFSTVLLLDTRSSAACATLFFFHIGKEVPARKTDPYGAPPKPCSTPFAARIRISRLMEF